MTKPNFFIVGAPKCGTTALYEYLRSHPNIFFPAAKEPHHFAEDFPDWNNMADSRDKYMSLFQETTNEHLAVGEASVWYLYSSVAISNIREFNKDAKIIVMLRNPVDLVYSLHSQMIYNRDESERDFQKAWNLQADRRNGHKIPKHCRQAEFLQYAEICKLGAQVERVLRIFSPEQVKLIPFDDFTTSTQAVYEDVLSFLGVPSDGRSDFPRIHENKRWASVWLGDFAQRPPDPLVHVAKNFKNWFGINRLGILDKIRHVSTRKVSRPPIPPTFRAELVNEFREDIEKLSQLLGRDLNHWYT